MKLSEKKSPRKKRRPQKPRNSHTMSLPKTIKYALTLGIGLLAAATFSAEEPSRTPSEKMKEAVDKFNKAPATIGQSLQGLKDAATAKLKQTLGGSTKPVANGEHG